MNFDSLILQNNSKNSRPPAKKIKKRRKIYKQIISSTIHTQKEFKKKYGIKLTSFKYLNSDTREYVLPHQGDILRLTNSFEENSKDISLRTLRRAFKDLVESKALNKRILVYKSSRLNKYIDKVCIYTVAPDAFKIIDELFPKTELELIEEEKRKERNKERYEEIKKKLKEAYEIKKQRQKEKEKLLKVFRRFKHLDIKMATLYINLLYNTTTNKNSYENYFKNKEFLDELESKTNKDIEKYEETIKKEIKNKLKGKSKLEKKYTKENNRKKNKEIIKKFKEIERNIPITRLIHEKFLKKIEQIALNSEKPILTFKNILLNLKDYAPYLKCDINLFMPYFLRITKKYISKGRLHFMQKFAPYRTDFYKISKNFTNKKNTLIHNTEIKEIVKNTKNPTSSYFNSLYNLKDFMNELKHDYHIKDIYRFFISKLNHKYKNKIHFMRRNATYKTDFYDLVGEFKDTHTSKWKMEGEFNYKEVVTKKVTYRQTGGIKKLELEL